MKDENITIAFNCMILGTLLFLIITCIISTEYTVNIFFACIAFLGNLDSGNSRFLTFIYNSISIAFLVSSYF